MKNLTPLQLPQLDTIPLSPQLGFYKIYLRDGVVYKLDGNGVETPIGNFVETEPLFTSSPAYSITLGNISQWNTAYGWGDHSTKGYLKTESDPVFVASPAYGISNALINQWSTAYGWGDHSVQGYLKTSLANTLYAPLVHTHTFAQITSKPTTLSGYGITDPIVLTSNAYSDPSWITALSWSKITGAPAFVTALAALTDVSLTSVADNQILRYSGGFWRNWSPDYLTAALADTLYIPFALRGAANGVASLNAQGQVPAAQLPSYVDDVLEFSSPAAFPVPGETGKIYVALNTNETYRWGGSSYIKIVGGEVQSVNLKTGNVLLNTDDIPEGISNLYYTNARVKTYGDTLYPQLTGVYNNPSWINTLSYTKLIDLPAFVQSTGTTNYVAKWAANGGLVNSIIFENGGVGINTNAVNAQAMLHVMGNNVRTKSLTLDSTWNYQTSFNMKNGNFSAEFNLGGSTKSANEGGPGSLQVSTYNASTNQYRYPITFFANGNVGLAGSLGSVPADNGNTLQVRGTIQQNSVISAMVKTDASGVLVPAVAGVDYLVSVPTPTLQFVTTAGNTTTNPVIFNTTVGAGVYPLVINDNTSAYLALNVVNATGTRSGGVRFQTGGVDRNVLVFDAAANLAFARYNSLGVYLSDTMTLFNATGNIGIGTTTDVGYKLDVWGNFRFKGADDSATAALRVENSSNSYYYSFQNNGYLIMNGFLSVPVIDQSSLNIRSNNLLIGATGTTLARLQLSGNTNSSGAVARGMYINTSQTATANNDSLVALDIDASFVPGTFTGVSSIALRTLNGEVRHQGLANVTTTSMIYYNPTTGRLTYGAVPEVPVPTLQSVTTAGNTTTNAITVGGLTVTGMVEVFKVGTSVKIRSLDKDVDFLGRSDNTGGFNFYGGGDYNTGGGISVTGNANTTSPSSIYFWRNGFTQSARFFSSGNFLLGSGTTDAGYKLDVDGTARLQGLVNGFVSLDTTNKQLQIINSGESPSANRGFAIYQNNNAPSGAAILLYKSRGTYDSPANVGSGDIIAAIGYRPRIGSSYPIDQALFGASMTSSTGISQFFTVGTTAGNYTPALLIAENGNIGIGPLGGTIITSLTLPTARLQVRGSGTTNASTAFRVENSSASASLLVLDNGNVLIGTTTDSTYKLDVNGTFRVSNNMYLTGRDASNNSRAIHIDTSASGNMSSYAQQYYNLNENAFYTQVVGSSVHATTKIIFRNFETSNGFTLFSTGNFYVGSGPNTAADAGFKLDVNGTGRYQGALTVYDNFNILRSTLLTDVFNIFSNTNSGINTPGRGQFMIFHGGREIMRAYADRTTFVNGGVQIGTNATPIAQLQVAGSVTAASSIARGVLFNNTLVAAANNDVLVGLDIDPAFTNGLFTGVSNYALRLGSSFIVNGSGTASGSTGNFTLNSFSSTFTDWRGAPYFIISKSASDTKGIYAATRAGEMLGQFIFGGVTSTGVPYSSFIIQATQVGTAGTTSGSIRSNLEFQYSNGSTYLTSLMLSSIGNVLIGTTSDAGYKLDVNGSARIVTSLVIGSPTVTNKALNVGGSVFVNNNNGYVGHDGSTGMYISATALTFVSYVDRYVFSFQYTNRSIWVQETTGGTQQNSAKLQIDSTTQGFLQPRMTNTQVLAITTPATGLQAYDTTNNKNVLYTGSAWQNIATEAWVLANAPQTWTTGSGFIYYNSGDVVIGATTNAGFKLDVYGAVRMNSTLTLGTYGAARLGSWTGGGQSQQFMQFDAANGWNFAIGNFTNVPYLDIRGDGRVTMGLEMDVLNLPTSALLNLVSTTRGFLAPRMTTAQRNAISSPATGLMVFDTTVNRVSTYSGSTWEVFARELERRFDTVGDASYVGKAISGSSESANVWTIRRIVTTSSGDAIVTTATNVAWTDRLTVTYS